MRSTAKAVVLAVLLAALPVAGAGEAHAAVGGQSLVQSRAAGRLQKFKIKKGKRRKKRLHALGGTCFGTSVLTATDELNQPFFPASVTPLTPQSFFFTDSHPHLIGGAVNRLRALLTDGTDPPMATLAQIGLGDLVLDEPGSGAIVGNAGRQLVTCPITSGTCTVIHDLGRPIFDVAAVGNGVFAVITTEPNGNEVIAILTPDGGEFHVATVSDFPGFFPRSIAVRNDVVYFGGFRELVHPTLTAVVMSVPVSGGLVREVAELGTANDQHLLVRQPDASDLGFRMPVAMTFLGDDLVIASEAFVTEMNGVGVVERSHLVRIHLGVSGIATGTEEIPVDVADGFVNVRDLESLGGELFVVDSRLRTSGVVFSGATFEPTTSGRILHVCPD
jgi:hypothetical protein